MPGQKTVIHPGAYKLANYLLELGKYRELIRTFALRDIRVQYAQTLLGLGWALIRPVFTLLIMVFVFGFILRADTEGQPAFLFTIIGLCGWYYFSTVLGLAGTSILQAQSVVKKIYFPRLVLPLSKALSGLLDYGILLLISILFLLFYHHTPSENIAYLPVFIALMVISTLGASFWVSALSILYRDVKHAVPLLLKLGLYASPVAYSLDMVPEKYLPLFHLNPLTGIIEGTRWSVLGGSLHMEFIMSSAIWAIALFLSGLLWFIRMERKIADHV